MNAAEIFVCRLSLGTDARAVCIIENTCAGIPHPTKTVVRARGFEIIEMDTTASTDGSGTKST
ncbi:unnamed protein product, partial [Rotaria sordida]